MRYVVVALFSLCVLAPVEATAQNSIYGVHGIGFPGQPVSARARSMGGGAGLFDARSALNPASVAAVGPLVVTASSGTTLRKYTALDSVVTGLSETKFPYAFLGTRVRGMPLSIALSYSSYVERSFDQITSDSVTVRGESIAVFDRLSASGAAADIRGAVAWRVMPRLSVGGAVHVLSGSVRLGSIRQFSDSRYFRLDEVSRVSLSGYGVSLGVLVTPTQQLTVGASLRSDTELKSTLDSVDMGSVELPVSYSAGVFLFPHPSIRWATTVQRHLWSSAAPDLDSIGGSRAFDTFSISSGVELGGVTGAPLRLGARYSQLPFSPSDEQASEKVLSAGTAFRFAGGRANFDFALERIMRGGAGAEERAWYLMFALTVMP